MSCRCELTPWRSPLQFQGSKVGAMAVNFVIIACTSSFLLRRRLHSPFLKCICLFPPHRRPFPVCRRTLSARQSSPSFQLVNALLGSLLTCSTRQKRGLTGGTRFESEVITLRALFCGRSSFGFVQSSILTRVCSHLFDGVKCRGGG